MQHQLYTFRYNCQQIVKERERERERKRGSELLARVESRSKVQSEKQDFSKVQATGTLSEGEILSKFTANVSPRECYVKIGERLALISIGWNCATGGSYPSVYFRLRRCVVNALHHGDFFCASFAKFRRRSLRSSESSCSLRTE